MEAAVDDFFESLDQLASKLVTFPLFLEDDDDDDEEEEEVVLVDEESFPVDVWVQVIFTPVEIIA
jgi:hypothetical protein